MNDNFSLKEAGITENRFFSDTGKYAYDNPDAYIAWATLQMQFAIWQELKVIKEKLQQG